MENSARSRFYQRGLQRGQYLRKETPLPICQNIPATAVKENSRPKCGETQHYTAKNRDSEAGIAFRHTEEQRQSFGFAHIPACQYIGAEDKKQANGKMSADEKIKRRSRYPCIEGTFCLPHVVEDHRGIEHECVMMHDHNQSGNATQTIKACIVAGVVV